MNPVFRHWLRPRLPVLSVACLWVAGAGGCRTTDTKTPKTSAAAATAKKPPVPNMRDPAGDMAFQAFLNRLRQAVAAHDIPTLAGMMTVDFGYRLEPPGEGTSAFAFWDQNNVWPQLEHVVNQAFLPKENYMVAPAEFVTDEAHYSGYRAGIRLDNGSWKLAYFVSN